MFWDSVFIFITSQEIPFEEESRGKEVCVKMNLKMVPEGSYLWSG